MHEENIRLSRTVIKMFELYIIRHGKTVANEKNLYCGATDLALSRTGKKEIRKNKEKDIYPPCDAYYTSGMRRCNETLEIITGKDTEFEPIGLLKEIGVGIFEMKSYEDLKLNKEYIAWISDKTGNFKCPKGESKNMFYQRVRIGFLGLTQRIMSNNHSAAMCITHGGVITAIMEGLFRDKKNFRDWQPKPGCGYKLTHVEEAGYISYEVIESK